MTDQELIDMELERLNKNLDEYVVELKVFREALDHKSMEEAKQLVALTKKLQAQIKCQNSDTELYGKNSFTATLNRQLVNAWVFAIENYGWHVKFDFRGDLITDLWIYTGDYHVALHDIYKEDNK